MKTFDAKKFAEAIQDKRAKDNLRNREIAFVCGITDHTLGFAIHQRGATLFATDYARLCSWLGVPMETFFNEQ